MGSRGINMVLVLTCKMHYTHKTASSKVRVNPEDEAAQGHHELKVLLSHQVCTVTVRGCCPLANPDL